MKRYSISFLITICIYVLFIGTYIYAFDIQKQKLADVKSAEKKIMLRVLIQKAKPVLSKSIKKKIKKKKKVIQKVVKKKVKKVVVQKEKKILKEVIKAKIKKTEVRNLLKRDEVITPIVEEEIKETINLFKESLKKEYYKELKNRIDSNKSYPRKAFKRSIQGKVSVEFIISPEGNLISFEILSGKKVFKKSIFKAIEMSFPFAPGENLFNEKISLVLHVNYTLG